MISFREEATLVFACFHGGPLSSWSNWNFEMLVFVVEGTPENLEKTLKARREPTANSTHIHVCSLGCRCIKGRGWGGGGKGGEEEENLRKRGWGELLRFFFFPNSLSPPPPPPLNTPV